MSLVSPGVSVTVIDESQSPITSLRDTIPLIVLATHQDKAVPSGTGVAASTTKAEAGELKLITSSRELLQEFGNPVFYDANGTPLQGYELNEYGLLAAYKSLNVANRCYVIRGDIDLAQLLPSSSEPSSDPQPNTYWLDLAETKFGIFRYNAGNDNWDLISPRVLNTTENLTPGRVPDNSFGKDGDIAVVTVNDSTTNGFVRVYEKLSSVWRAVGSNAWDTVSPTQAIGDTVFSSASNQSLAGLPQASDTITIDVNSSGSPVTVTLETIVDATANLSTNNTLGLKTFIANGNTVTLGTTSGGTITGTTEFASNTAPTGVSVGDILQITDIAGTDNITMRIKVVGSGFVGPLTGSLDVNGVTVDLTGVTTITDFVNAVNNAVGSSGTNPQGITASNQAGEIQLLKDTAIEDENNEDQLAIDITGVTGGTTGLATGTTNVDVQEVAESVNDQVTNTNNVTASVSGSGPFAVAIADSATAISLSNAFGTPRNDLGLATRSSVPLADLETEIEAGVSGTEVDDDAGNDVPNAGESLRIRYSGTGDFVIESGNANTELGFTSGTYRVPLNQVVSQVNASDANGGWATSFSTTIGNTRIEDGQVQFTVTNNDSNPFVISGAAAVKLGIAGTFTSSQLYLATNANEPVNPQQGDIWVRTNTPNDGADYVVKVWNSLTSQWTVSDAPLFVDNNAAFDNYSVNLSSGDLYVQYNADEVTPAEATFRIFRYNGSSTLELEITNFTPSAGNTIQISNGRDSLASVVVDDVTAFINAVNVLNQNNLEAELNSNGRVVLRNTAGEDIVLADGSVAVSAVTTSQFDAGTYSNWVSLRSVEIGNVTGYEASFTAPTSDPEEGQYWFNSSISKDDIDLLVKDAGTQQWVTFAGNLQVRATRPTTRDDASSSALVDGDIWINTSDLEQYPLINKWNAGTSRWVLVDNTDQTTSNGVLFADARPMATANLDPDAPNPLLFPAGMLLWNTRASSFGVREYRPNWFGDETDPGESFDNTDYTVTSYDVGNDSFPALAETGRWINASGNRNDGSPYMGREAQRILIIRAMAAAITVNEDLRDIRRNFFNLMLAPGYPELIDELVSLNIDRKQTSFIITDTPFRLRNNSTEIQDWSTNANNAPSTGDDGLTTRDIYSAIYYPPTGLTTNLDGVEVATPSSLGALYAYIFNDTVAYPWFPPAGLNRGLLSGIFSSVGIINAEDEYQPVQISSGLQDALYVNNVNPLVFTPGRGLYVNGDKTLSPTVSALDRINVARLIVYLRYQFEILAEEFLFEVNDQITRDQVKNTFDRFLGDLIGLRALGDFLVVSDDSNNTPERIDRNELWVDIAIQPLRSINFIFVPVRIRNSGDDLTI